MKLVLNGIGDTPTDVGPPWFIWVYLAIGVVVGLWYQRREGNPEREHSGRAQSFLIVAIACMWPIFLVAALANPPE